MIDKLLKSRKDKKSDCCNRIIKSGEMYNKIAFRAPKFDEDDLQIGVVTIYHFTVVMFLKWPFNISANVKNIGAVAL